MAQTSPKAPPKPPVDATPVSGGEPSISGPDGVTVPLTIMDPTLIAPDRVVIQVGDVKLTAGQLSQILDGYSDSQKVFVNGPGRQQFIDQVVRLMVLAEDPRFHAAFEEVMAQSATDGSEGAAHEAAANAEALAAVAPAALWSAIVAIGRLADPRFDAMKPAA